MSGQIFISYRREDSSGSTGRLYDRLSAHFPRNQIFIDVDNLDPGVDYFEAIEENVGSSEVFIAVIGKHWLTACDTDGNRRLQKQGDLVRIEVAAALKRNIRVIPVLVDGASMPELTELPDDLRLLRRRNALEISHARFDADLRRLIAALERVFEKAKTEAGESFAEAPKVIIPVSPERKKPAPSSSVGTGRKGPTKQVTAFLAIAIVLIVGGLIYLANRPFQSPPPSTAPMAAITPAQSSPPGRPANSRVLVSPTALAVTSVSGELARKVDDLFRARCAACHESGAPEQADPLFVGNLGVLAKGDEINFGVPEDSRLYLKLLRDMPKLTAAEKAAGQERPLRFDPEEMDLVLRWIKAGAPVLVR